VGSRLLLADAACLPWALRLAAASRGAISSLVLLGPLASFQQADLAAAPAGTCLAFAESLITGCPDTSLALSSAPGGVALIVYTSGAHALLCPPVSACCWGGMLAARLLLRLLLLLLVRQMYVPALSALSDASASCTSSLSCSHSPTTMRVPAAGTTGKPKGVALTHSALHAQSMAKLLTVITALLWPARSTACLIACFPTLSGSPEPLPNLRQLVRGKGHLCS
jgi:hypothetical protein